MTAEEREALANDIQKLPHPAQLLVWCYLDAKTEDEQAEVVEAIIAKYQQTQVCFKQA